VAARWWRSVLAGSLLLAALSAFALAHAGALGAWWSACVALLLLVALPLLFVATSLTLARSADPRGWSGSQIRCSVAALLSETLHFSLAIIAMCADPREPPDASAQPGRAPAPPGRTPVPPGRAPHPVLLIHGILCNRAVWRRLRPLLERAGFAPVRAVNLEPLCASIEQHAQRLAPVVLALQRDCGGAPVRLVGHSMGGLVARALLRQLGPQAIERIVTLGTPHHGTTLARGLRWPATREMAPQSPWLAQLNDAQEGRLAVPLHSVYSLDDNLVAPARSAQLRGAELRELRGIGHFGLLVHRHVLSEVIAALEPRLEPECRP
jgi:pimeloyl-ACP methyl ester carboxylesterase